MQLCLICFTILLIGYKESWLIMKTYNAIVSERIYIQANNEKEAIDKIEKHYNKLGLYSVDVKILEKGK